MKTTIKQNVNGSSDQVSQAPFRQDQLRNLVDVSGGKTFSAKTKDGLKDVFRLKWSEWKTLLTEDQIKTVNGYAQWLFGSKSPFAVLKDEQKHGKKKKAIFCRGLIDTRLSVLRPKGHPSHHSDYRVDRHFNSQDGWHKLPELSKADIAHHLFDLDTTVYFVSNSSGAASHALLAFDIDAKKDDATGSRPDDALAFAYAIRDFIDWGDDFCRIQSSTSGFGAYVYFILNYGSYKYAKEINAYIKQLREVVSTALQPQFKATLDAIKGDIPIFAKKDDVKTIISQGNLVRLPVVENLEDLNSFISVKPVPLEGLVHFITPTPELQAANSLRSSAEHSTSSTTPSNVSLGLSSISSSTSSISSSTSSTSSTSSSLTSSPLSPLSLSTGVSNARKPCEKKETNKSQSPMKRVYEALKQYRDQHHTDPKDYQDFNNWYEGLGLNTGKATEARRKRYEEALKQLGPYRKAEYTRYCEDDYKWVEEHLSEEDLKKTGRKRKQTLRMIELKLVQFVVGLATASSQPGIYDYGCPMNRIKEMHETLHKNGILPKPFGKNGRNRYGCYVKMLKESGLVEELQAGNSLTHMGRKLIVTEKDQVFGGKCQKRIDKARQSKSKNAQDFVQIENAPKPTSDTI